MKYENLVEEGKKQITRIIYQKKELGKNIKPNEWNI
jgi:hypothetical protein